MTQMQIHQALKRGRSSGIFSMVNMELEQVPPAVYDEKVEVEDVKWWEVEAARKVNLSGNVLSAVPAALLCIDTLLELDLSHNSLAELPSTMDQLVALKVLNLAHNKLRVLPAETAQMPALVQLDVSHNQLQSLPDGLGSRAKQAGLNEILASNNAVVAIPSGLGNATNLHKLDLQNNAIESVDTWPAAAPPKLTHINLSYNRIGKRCPPNLFTGPKLKVVDLRSNRLVVLPDDMGSAPELVELFLGHNSITFIPEGISTFPSLLVLELRNNKLKTVPASIAQLQLTMLDLSNNDLAGLPPEMGTMTSLRSLRLEGNPIRSIPQHVVSGPISGLLTHLEARMPDTSSSLPLASSSSLPGAVQRTSSAGGAEPDALQTADGLVAVDSKGRGLKEVPRDLVPAEPGTLGKLDVSYNQIASFPASALLPHADVCTSINLSRNRLTAWPLPLGVRCLPELRELNLSSNPLPDLPPDAFEATPLLEYLNLSGCPCVSSIPAGAFLPLRQLTTLELQSAHLADLPEDIPNLTSLRNLQLQSNQLSHLPAALTLLTNLEVLDVTNNSLLSIPPELGKMELREFHVQGNILRGIRRSVLDKGTQSLLEYLKAKIPDTAP